MFVLEILMVLQIYLGGQAMSKAPEIIWVLIQWRDVTPTELFISEYYHEAGTFIIWTYERRVIEIYNGTGGSARYERLLDFYL